MHKQFNIYLLQTPETFKSQILVAVGDSLTISEQDIAYKEATGRSMGSIPRFLARFIITINEHVQGL